MAERTTVVYPNPQILAEAVAARTLLTITDYLSEPNRTRVDIAVTGGTDGNRVFDAMNASPLNDAVDWSRVHVWWGDERFVAADSDDRNAKQARERSQVVVHLRKVHTRRHMRRLSSRNSRQLRLLLLRNQL